MSRAKTTVFPNKDVSAVQRAIRDNPGKRAVIVTDALFSVDGDLAPLEQLAEVAEAHDAVLVVDEAHSLGVLGDTGEGACAAAGIDHEHLVRTFTLSKALGSQGGGVAASEPVIEHLINSARTFIFDTGLAPAAVGSALAATTTVLSRPDLPALARAATDNLADIAEHAGWQPNPHDAAVASIPVGTPAQAVRAQQVCAREGVDVGCFRPPSVPDGIARLRMTGHADLTDDDLNLVEKALRAAREAT